MIAFAYLCFTVLAPWQLGKNTKTSRENSQISRSLQAEPVPLTSVLPQQDSSAPDEQWQRVTATGHYLPDRQVLARLRVIEGDPAFEVLVPFAVDGGPTVLVDRGYVKPEQGSRVPPIAPAPAGTVTIVAQAARLRALTAGQGTVPGGRSAAGVRDQHPADLHAARRPTDRGLSAAGRESAGRPRCDRRCRTWTRDRSCPTASSGSRSASSRQSGWATSSRRRSGRVDAREAAAQSRPASAALTTEEKLADRYGKRR